MRLQDWSIEGGVSAERRTFACLKPAWLASGDGLPGPLPSSDLDSFPAFSRPVNTYTRVDRE